MRKFLDIYIKNNLFVLVFCLIATVIGGCGKDDKDVTQNVLSYPFDSFENSHQINDTYYANRPTTLEADDIVGGGLRLTWLPPSDTTNLLAYNIYNSKDGGSSFNILASVGLVNTYDDTTATVAGTYFYQVTSQFMVYDKNAKYYNNTIESMPTDIASEEK